MSNILPGSCFRNAFEQLQGSPESWRKTSESGVGEDGEREEGRWQHERNSRWTKPTYSHQQEEQGTRVSQASSSSTTWQPRPWDEHERYQQHPYHQDASNIPEEPMAQRQETTNLSHFNQTDTEIEASSCYHSPEATPMSASQTASFTAATDTARVSDPHP